MKEILSANAVLEICEKLKIVDQSESYATEGATCKKNYGAFERKSPRGFSKDNPASV